MEKAILEKLYTRGKKSCKEIGNLLGYSPRKVDYWIKKHNIRKRSISEAVYSRYHPKGDPFSIHKLATTKDFFLYGLGLGLYWGEGTKSNNYSVRLGNTDPKLIKKFIEFLSKIYGVNRKRLKFGLQVFSDMPAQQALRFWVEELNVKKTQFQKVIITPTRGLGTYRKKIRHGVLTVYFNNKKLRDILCGEIEKIGRT